jgi:N-acetylglucosaminyl-diphospho-decaprenol L-rhamnosyltransferase
VEVSVVIVNWNAGEALAACVASVAADRGGVGEVVLVDNASTDGSVARVRAQCPSVRVVEVGRNAGFAAGANRGAAARRADVVVFLNPDARVEAGAIRTLVDALLVTPGAGIAGGGLRDERGRWQPAAARFAPVSHLLLDTTPGRIAARRRRSVHRVDWVYGTFMAVRGEVFRQLGGFDERYFVYGEDLDLCHRAAHLGVRTIHVPAARAVHGRNVSAAQRFGVGREAAVVEGELAFYARRGRAGDLRRFRVVAACKFGVKAALAAALGRHGTVATYGRVVRACVAFDARRATAAEPATS